MNNAKKKIDSNIYSPLRVLTQKYSNRQIDKYFYFKHYIRLCHIEHTIKQLHF